jgi:hypothetical protein
MSLTNIPIVVYYTQLETNRANGAEGLEMADDDKKHGAPAELGSRTGERWADTPLDVQIPVRFWFRFPDGRTIRIPDNLVPARAWDRVATYMVEGTPGLEKPPSHPQPNDAVGILPPPSPVKDKE